MPFLITIKTFLFRNEILLLLVLNFDTYILLKYSYEPNRVRIVLVTSRDHIDGILRINGNPVKVDRKAKFLGIIFDSRLTWNDHVNYVVQKCKKRLNLLRAISGNSWGANKKTLLMIYRSLIRSVLDYGAIA